MQADRSDMGEQGSAGLRRPSWPAGVAPFWARHLVMRVVAAQVIRVSECWTSRS
ncbi:hypothetical protein M271_49850 [Streptomyces rapamycinicus NRRL 5491]|nr:hypothetical protein M271_49850 [Streptomyces rapamycinicus NRRL 5491]